MEISRITGCLYVAPRHAGEVRELDLALLIDKLATRRPPRVLQVPAHSLRTFDFRLLPIPLRALNRSVGAVLPVIQAGRGVLAYCHGGRHRSVAMASAILVAMGYPAQEAMQPIGDRRAQADPWAGHIQRQLRGFEACGPKRHPAP